MGAAALPRRLPSGRAWIGAALVPFALLLGLVLVLIFVAGGVVNPGSATCRPATGAALPGNLDAPGSLGGVAGTGLSREQVLTVRNNGGTANITAGTYATTSYGPPWGGIQGAGHATAGGILLNGGSPRYYMVAVDPAPVSLGSLIYIWPNPFNWRGPFLAADTGGAIDQRRVDFYDWRGRSAQSSWGRRDARVSATPIRGADTAAEPVSAPAAAGDAAIDFSALEQAARDLHGRPAGFAIADPHGHLVAQSSAERPNIGRSASKVLILVALARRASRRTMTDRERSLATAMIEQSDNAAASALYAQVGGAAVDAAATAAGMTGWRRDTSDPVYTLGRSQLTAADLARLFAALDQLLPRRHRDFAEHLLANVQGAGRFGFIGAGLPGTVLTKGGWSPEGSRGWTVNQGARVQLGGSAYGVAVVLGAQHSFAAGADQIRHLAEQLAQLDTSAAAAAAGACGSAGDSGGEITATGPLGERIGEIARSHLGAGPSITGFEPPSIGVAWCAWFATNVWKKAGVAIDVNYGSNAPYFWAQQHNSLFKKDGEPPKGDTPPQGSALMYGSGPENTDTSEHVNLVDHVNPDGSFMVTGGNQDGGRVTRYGPCRLRRTEPAYLSGPGCDPRPIYGIAVPSADGNSP